MLFRSVALASAPGGLHWDGGVTDYHLDLDCRALLLAPSAEFVATLPGRRIPDRNDFFAMSESGRIRAWEQVRRASTALGDELGELISAGRLADRVEACESPNQVTTADRTRTHPPRPANHRS